MEVKIRYGFYFVTLAMIIYSYYISPQRFSSKEKCKRLLPFKCNLVWYGLMSILIVLEGIFLYYLNSHIKLSEKLPSIWYLIPILLSVFIVHLLYTGSEQVKDTGKFIASPDAILTKNKRNSIFTFIILLYIASISLEGFYTLKGKLVFSSIPILFRSVKDNLFYKDYFGYSKIIALLVMIYMKKVHENYGACAYELPVNWNS